MSILVCWCLVALWVKDCVFLTPTTCHSLRSKFWKKKCVSQIGLSLTEDICFDRASRSLGESIEGETYGMFFGENDFLLELRKSQIGVHHIKSCFNHQDLHFNRFNILPVEDEAGIVGDNASGALPRGGCVACLSTGWLAAPGQRESSTWSHPRWQFFGHFGRANT